MPAEEANNVDAGYRLQGVYAQRLHFEEVGDDEDLPESDGEDIGLGWDWRSVGDAVFEVKLGVKYRPNQARPENIEAVMVARFEVGTGTPPIEFRRFVRYAAPTMLLPYVRHALADLSGRGMFPQIQLQPLNMFEAMGVMDPGSTVGERQLAEVPELAERLHVAPLGDRTGDEG